MSIDAALNEVTKVYNTFKSVEKVKETLEAVKGFENVEKETRQRIEKLKAEEAKLQSKQEAASAKAEKIIEDAAAVMLEAQAKAAKTVQDAEGKARAAIENADDHVRAQEKYLIALKNDASEVQASIEVKHKAVNDLDAKLAKLKAEAAKFAGG